MATKKLTYFILLLTVLLSIYLHSAMYIDLSESSMIDHIKSRLTYSLISFTILSIIVLISIVSVNFFTRRLSKKYLRFDIILTYGIIISVILFSMNPVKYKIHNRKHYVSCEQADSLKSIIYHSGVIKVYFSQDDLLSLIEEKEGEYEQDSIFDEDYKPYLNVKEFLSKNSIPDDFVIQANMYDSSTKYLTDIHIGKSLTLRNDLSSVLWYEIVNILKEKDVMVYSLLEKQFIDKFYYRKYYDTWGGVGIVFYSTNEFVLLKRQLILGF